jgi:hypothetical protein
MTGFLADLVAGSLHSELLPVGGIDSSRLFTPA